MTQLNSPFQTALQRRYLPVFISLILLGVFGAIVFPPVPPLGVVIGAAVVIASVATVYFCVYRAIVAPTVDRVILDGDVLRVVRGRREMAIPVSSIAAIRSHSSINPETVTLHLAKECEFGDSITFIPPARFRHGEEHPIVASLRLAVRDSERSLAARRSS